MEIAHKTTLLWLANLSTCTSVIAYSRESFKLHPGKFFISQVSIEGTKIEDLLSSTPIPSSIDEIKSNLLLLEDYQENKIYREVDCTTDIDSEDPDLSNLNFLLNFDLMHEVIKDDGIDTLIFLEDNRILAYTILDGPMGRRIDESAQYFKSYKLNNLTLTFSTVNSVANNPNNNPFNENVKEIRLVNRDWSNVGFLKVKDIRGAKGQVSIQSRCTDNVTDIFSGGSDKVFYFDNTSILVNNSTGTIEEVRLERENSISDNLHGFGNVARYQVGYYKGDLVIYSWNNTGAYYIASLTKKDYWKHAYYYDREYQTLPELFGGNIEIIEFCGKYVRVNDGTDNWIVNLDKNSIVCKEGEEHNYLLDPGKPKNKIVDLGSESVFFDRAEMIQKIPGISNTLTDLRDGRGLKVIKKYGSWFVLSRDMDKSKILNPEYLMVLNSSRCLWILPEELNNVIFVNDKTAILKDPKTEKVYYLNRAGKFGSPTVIKKGLKGVSEIPDYSYQNGKYVTNSFLNNLRKSSDLPEGNFNIIGAVGGLVFYKENNIINCL